MFIRKAATVVAGSVLALGLAVTPAAAAEPLTQPTAAAASAGLVAPTAWYESMRFSTRQECNTHRFEVAKHARTTDCGWKYSPFRPGGYWSFQMWR